MGSRSTQYFVGIIYSKTGILPVMGKFDANRLKKLRESLGISQSELARRSGSSQQTINRLEHNLTDSPRTLLSIARALQTTPEYLMGEVDDPGPSAVASPARSFAHFPDEAEQLDLVGVQEIDLKFGMGATELEIPVTTQIRHFSREWLRQYTHANPEALYFARGIGDSMAPTLLDSDLLLIDTSERSIRLADKIWAVAFYGSGMVKRLRPSREGVRIMSDNPAVSEEIAHDGELHVLGRVVAIVRKM